MLSFSGHGIREGKLENALRTAICVVIGALMASTLCFTSFDLPSPLHGVPYVLAVALAVNAPPAKGPGALAAMVAGLVLATTAYAVLTHQGLYKELYVTGHTQLALATLALCAVMEVLDRLGAGKATYDRFPPVRVVYGLLTVAAVIMFPIGRGQDLFTPEFEIVRRLIVYATLFFFYPGLILAIGLNFLRPRRVARRQGA